MKLNHGIIKYTIVDIFEIDEYLKEASDNTKTKNVIKKIIFLFLLYIKLLFGKIIRKQQINAIRGMYNGL